MASKRERTPWAASIQDRVPGLSAPEIDIQGREKKLVTKVDALTQAEMEDLATRLGVTTNQFNRVYKDTGPKNKSSLTLEEKRTIKNRVRRQLVLEELRSGRVEKLAGIKTANMTENQRRVMELAQKPARVLKSQGRAEPTTSRRARQDTAFAKRREAQQERLDQQRDAQFQMSMESKVADVAKVEEFTKEQGQESKHLGQTSDVGVASSATAMAQGGTEEDEESQRDSVMGDSDLNPNGSPDQFSFVHWHSKRDLSSWTLQELAADTVVINPGSMRIAGTSSSGSMTQSQASTFMADMIKIGQQAIRQMQSAADDEKSVYQALTKLAWVIKSTKQFEKYQGMRPYMLQIAGFRKFVQGYLRDDASVALATEQGILKTAVKAPGYKKPERYTLAFKQGAPEVVLNVDEKTGRVQYAEYEPTAKKRMDDDPSGDTEHLTSLASSSQPKVSAAPVESKGTGDPQHGASALLTAEQIEALEVGQQHLNVQDALNEGDEVMGDVYQRRVLFANVELDPEHTRLFNTADSLISQLQAAGRDIRDAKNYSSQAEYQSVQRLLAANSIWHNYTQSQPQLASRITAQDDPEEAQRQFYDWLQYASTDESIDQQVRDTMIGAFGANREHLTVLASNQEPGVGGQLDLPPSDSGASGASGSGGGGGGGAAQFGNGANDDGTGSKDIKAMQTQVVKDTVRSFRPRYRLAFKDAANFRRMLEPQWEEAEDKREGLFNYVPNSSGEGWLADEQGGNPIHNANLVEELIRYGGKMYKHVPDWEPTGVKTIGLSTLSEGGRGPPKRRRVNPRRVNIDAAPFMDRSRGYASLKPSWEINPINTEGMMNQKPSQPIIDATHWITRDEMQTSVKPPTTIRNTTASGYKRSSQPATRFNLLRRTFKRHKKL